MGHIISKIKHPFRDFNLEQRAHKFISKPPSKAAPKHANDQLDIERMKNEYPEVFAESLKKNPMLDKHLKDVYVVSHDDPIKEEPPPNPSRPLPQDRTQPEPFLFGHKEPDRIPAGKTTLRNALKFISLHQDEPMKYSPAYIAEEHKLPEDLVKKILMYYRVFQIYMPDTETNTKATFAGPSTPKVHIIKDRRKTLPEPEVKKEKDET